MRIHADPDPDADADPDTDPDPKPWNGQYHSLSGTYFSASNRVTCLLPATQAGSHAGPKVYI